MFIVYLYVTSDIEVNLFTDFRVYLLGHSVWLESVTVCICSCIFEEEVRRGVNVGLAYVT